MRNPISGRRSTGQGGFTLVEVLVVVLVIAILATIAIPALLNRRYSAFITDVRHALRNAATSATGYAAGNDGSYIGLSLTDLTDEGLLLSDHHDLTVVTASQSEFCIEVEDDRLSGRPPWDIAHFDSSESEPLAGSC